jgi:hypothetical protein
MTTLCTTNNLLLLWNQPNVAKPHWNIICIKFLNDWKLKPTIEQTIVDPD